MADRRDVGVSRVKTHEQFALNEFCEARALNNRRARMLAVLALLAANACQASDSGYMSPRRGGCDDD